MPLQVVTMAGVTSDVLLLPPPVAALPIHPTPGLSPTANLMLVLLLLPILGLPVAPLVLILIG